MSKINRIIEATLTTKDGLKYDIVLPESDNYFRFFPALSEVVGTTTSGIKKLTVDNIIMPKDMFKAEIMDKHFILNAVVLVGEGVVSLYELQMDIKIANNAYSSRNVKPAADDDQLVAITPLQIEIPAYKTISFKEIIE